MKRIHIVGCPRSGTTLALEAIAASFDIDGYSSQELPYWRMFRIPDDAHRVHLSKHPRDFPVVRRLLEREPDLHVVFLVRDPRDVIVSRHRLAPDRFWCNLRLWRLAHRAARAVNGHPRCVEVRYEQLVRDPESIQRRLAERFPFLKLVASLLEFARAAQPSKQSLEALHELRPIDTGSIGRWRDHLPRIAGQIARHGPITHELIELGYERDDRWLEALRGVEPDFTESREPESPGLLERLRHGRHARRDWRRYLRARP